MAERRTRVAGLLAALVLGAGLGALAPSQASAKEEKAEGAPTEADLRLELSGMGLPVIQSGRVVNYVFVRIRVNLNPGITRPAIDAGEPFLRERMLKSAYRTPLNSGQDLMTLDAGKLQALTLAEARAVYGPARVKSVEVRDQKPQKRLYSPPPSTGSTSRPIPP